LLLLAVVVAVLEPCMTLKAQLIAALAEVVED
jgi:hypothetical protein